MYLVYGTWITSFFPPAIALLLLLYVIHMDPYIEKKHRGTIVQCVLTVLITLLLEVLHAVFEVQSRIIPRTLVDICSYICRPLAIVLLLHILQPEKKQLHAWVLLALNTGVHLTALFSRICFWIDSFNHFHRGPLGFTSHIISSVLLLELSFLSVRTSFRNKKRESLLSVFNVMLILIGLILDLSGLTSDIAVSLTTYVMVIVCVFYYIWLHLRFVSAHENALMAEQRIQIMMSQIQPHFLYNTLSTIQALCRIDPEKAFFVTERFGAYLRQNIDALSQPQRIPVEKELEHTRIYAEIEAVRFPNIHVEYDIRDTDFSLPALTIQPLLENAIRHGIRIRKDGRVLVRTRAEERFHTITISDNGKGFDTARTERGDSAHIGLKNVRDRITSMCGGSMEILSRLNEGTTIIIRIPKA